MEGRSRDSALSASARASPASNIGGLSESFDKGRFISSHPPGRPRAPDYGDVGLSPGAGRLAHRGLYARGLHGISRALHDLDGVAGDEQARSGFGNGLEALEQQTVRVRGPSVGSSQAMVRLS